LTRPFRLHEIIRMTFDVQKGMAHTRKRAICPASERTWKARK
jgi:hypothetical protein